ncbi:MAG: hypothetical protein WBW37_18830 [Methyloceanibacter sp.]
MTMIFDMIVFLVIGVAAGAIASFYIATESAPPILRAGPRTLRGPMMLLRVKAEIDLDLGGSNGT